MWPHKGCSRKLPSTPYECGTRKRMYIEKEVSPRDIKNAYSTCIDSLVPALLNNPSKLDPFLLASTHSVLS